MTQTFDALRIMVVEDHQFQRMVAVKVVSGLGVASVQEAEDGQDALDKIAASSDPIDITICDLDMPGMDGIEFIRHVAEKKLTSAIVVASAMEPELIRTVEDMAAEHGMKVLGTLEKPINPEKVKALFEQFISEQSSAGARSGSSELVITKDMLITAIKDGQIIPWYQPKVLIRNGQWVSCEALARWQHPEKGMIYPGQFINEVETFGLMDDMTDSIISQSVQQIQQWQSEGRPINTSVNISPSMLGNTQLPEKLMQMIKAVGIGPELLTLEITESAVMENVAHCLSTLARLKMKGFTLSIDDFGTGYSSMQQLNRIPFSELKIDQSFVKDAVSDPTRRAIVEANIELARKLKLKTVAEGLESAADWQLLNDLQCDVAQGYFVGKPMPADQFPAWEAEWKQTYSTLNADRPGQEET